MSKEKDELVDDGTPPTMEEVVKNVIQRACGQRGKLKMHVVQRGGRTVDEHLEFNSRDLGEIKMRSDCSLSLTFAGCRYWLSTMQENHEVLRHIMYHASITGERDLFMFPEEVSFHGTMPEVTTTQTKKVSLATA